MPQPPWGAVGAESALGRPAEGRSAQSWGLPRGCRSVGARFWGQAEGVQGDSRGASVGCSGC